MADETPLQREITRRMRAIGIRSMRELSLRAGLGETAVKAIMRGKSKDPRGRTLAAIAKALGCTPNELARDPLVQSGPDIALNSNGSVARLGHPDKVTDSAVVHEVGVSAAAGGDSMAELEQIIAHWQFPREWLLYDLRVEPANLRIITIEGDSMINTLMPGDKVVLDISKRVPSPPGLFAVWDGIGLVAKRLEHIEGSDPVTVRLISDNARYTAYERTADEIAIVGRIVGRWQRL